MNIKKNLVDTIFHPSNIILFLDRKNIIRINDEIYLKLLYRKVFNKRLDLKNPKNFNEKLQWLKIHDRKDIYTTMVDKYEVKKYVSNIIGEEYVIPTLGIYNTFDEIDFSSLPEQFVIKCTHDSASIVICKNKNELKIDEVREKINKCLKRNMFYIGREWPYKNVKPRIIVEKYMCPANCNYLDDFKLQTFNGKVAYSFVCTERDTNVKFTFFDREKKFIDVTQCESKNDPQNAKLPENYEKLVELAEKLAKNIPEVRVDFYNIEGKIYFGELTFFDSSGFGKFEPEEWDRKFGDMLNLSTINTEEEDKNEK